MPGRYQASVYLRRRMYQPATSTMRMPTTNAHTVTVASYER